MGEIIKRIGKIHIADVEFDVELNAANYKGGERIIHIQNEKGRYEFAENDFLKAVTLILCARDYMNYYKNCGKLENDKKNIS